MASPYTQDINKTVQATRKQNKASYSEQLVGLFGKYVEKEQERAQENVSKLETDFVFEKQKINSNIKNYNNNNTISVFPGVKDGKIIYGIPVIKNKKEAAARVEDIYKAL